MAGRPFPLRPRRPFRAARPRPWASVPVVFFDAEHQCGATVELSGNQAGDELTVQLQPNGRAKARFVGPDGRPIAGFRLNRCFELVVTPGPPLNNRHETAPGPAASRRRRHGKHRSAPLQGFPPADADGRVTLPNLVPGAVYRICDRSTNDVPDKGDQVRRDFTVKPGEELDLGDILIEKPQG